MILTQLPFAVEMWAQMGQITVDSFQHSRDSLTGGVVHPILYSIKWVPSTKWVCTPQLLVSTKWLHTPSDVLMLNVLLEWVCNPFCRKWVYRHVCSPRWSLQNGCWKLWRSTNSQSTSKEELYKMTLSFKGRVDLQNGVYKLGWPNPTYPQN